MVLNVCLDWHPDTELFKIIIDTIFQIMSSLFLHHYYLFRRLFWSKNQHFHRRTMKSMTCKHSLFIKGRKAFIELTKNFRILINIRTNLAFPTTLCILRIQTAKLVEKPGVHAMVLCAMKHAAIKTPL